MEFGERMPVGATGLIGWEMCEFYKGDVKNSLF